MTIKQILLFSFITMIFEGSVIIHPMCFSQVLPSHQTLTNDFRQLTNQELAQYYYEQEKQKNQAHLLPFADFAKHKLHEKQIVHLAADIHIYYQGDEYFLLNHKSEYIRRLEWQVQMNKTIYRPGERIKLDIFICNASDKELILVTSSLVPISFYSNSISLKKIEFDEKKHKFKKSVLLTENGFRDYIDLTGTEKWSNILSQRLFPHGKQLKIHNVIKGKSLEQIYDLSESGTYELTFYTRNFLADDEHQIAEFPKPCTIRFKIEGLDNWQDKQVVWSEEKENKE
jgi:hypothetical protein